MVPGAPLKSSSGSVDKLHMESPELKNLPNKNALKYFGYTYSVVVFLSAVALAIGFQNCSQIAPLATASRAVASSDLLRIKKAPKDIDSEVGATVTLTVEVAQDDVTYQWFKDDTLIPGATKRELVMEKLTREHSGRYTVRVSRGEAVTQTKPAHLTVK